MNKLVKTVIIIALAILAIFCVKKMLDEDGKVYEVVGTATCSADGTTLRLNSRELERNIPSVENKIGLNPNEKADVIIKYQLDTLDGETHSSMRIVEISLK